MSVIEAQSPAGGPPRHLLPPLARARFSSTGSRQVLGIVLLLVVWQGSFYVNDMSPLVPYPAGVVSALWSMLHGPERSLFLSSVVATSKTVALGFLISAALGTVVGFVVGRYRVAHIAIYPYLNAVYATPRLALLPLVVVWFGIGMKTALVVIVLSSGFHVAIGAAEGVRNSSADLVPVARSFGAKEWQIVTKVVLPASLPYLLASWKLGAGRAVVAGITAELFVDLGNGLGRLLSNFSASLELDKSFAVMIVVAVLGFLFMAFFELLERLVRRVQGRVSTD